MKFNIFSGLGMLKVFPWGAPGKVSQLRGPLGGGSGQPRKALGSCVVLGKQNISGPVTVLNKFIFKACGRTVPKLLFGLSPTTLKTNFHTDVGRDRYVGPRGTS